MYKQSPIVTLFSVSKIVLMKYCIYILNLILFNFSIVKIITGYNNLF